MLRRDIRCRTTWSRAIPVQHTLDQGKHLISQSIRTGDNCTKRSLSPASCPTLSRPMTERVRGCRHAVTRPNAALGERQHLEALLAAAGFGDLEVELIEGANQAETAL